MQPPTEKSAQYVEWIRQNSARLEEYADEIERTSAVSDEIWKYYIDEDMCRLTLPEQWGGAGLSVAEYVPVLEEAAKISGATRMILHGQNGMWRLVEQWGTEDQKARWLPIHRDGGIFTFALTEPGNGTGRDITTTAVRDGDDWVVNGTKHLISLGTQAELVHLIAATGKDDRGGATATCFLVPKGTKGVTYLPLPETMGCRGMNHDLMVMDDARLPGDAVLGDVGQGLHLGLRGFLDISRLCIAASCVGLARRATELACDFSKQRVTFGRPIAARQAVKMLLAEMICDVYATDQAVRAVAEKYDRGESIEAEAAMCKYLGIEMVGRVTDRALRVHGGIGYTEQHKIERHYRDARAMWFEEGTAEIQKIVVANQLLAGNVDW